MRYYYCNSHNVHDFLVLQGVKILFRSVGKHYNYVVTNTLGLGDMNTNNYKNRSIFDGVIGKIKVLLFLWTTV